MTYVPLALFALLMTAGAVLLLRTPPAPPPDPELEQKLNDLARAFNEVGQRLGEALLPVMTAMATAFNKAGYSITRNWPRPADPNPFPRFHLFRKARRR